jgi:hypothetical protein
MQTSAWSNVGWNLLRDGGLARWPRLCSRRHQSRFPGLSPKGVVADAAFVDGSHRFHEVFVDLYILRKIVRPMD